MSYASNLVPGDTNSTFDVSVRDMQSGVTERVSIASDGTEGNGSFQWAAISADELCCIRFECEQLTGRVEEEIVKLIAPPLTFQKLCLSYK